MRARATSSERSLTALVSTAAFRLLMRSPASFRICVETAMMSWKSQIFHALRLGSRQGSHLRNFCLKALSLLSEVELQVLILGVQLIHHLGCIRGGASEVARPMKRRRLGCIRRPLLRGVGSALVNCASFLHRFFCRRGVFKN